MKPEQLESYLERIGMQIPEAPSLNALRQIQERHIYAIPVENLDIIQGNLPLSLEIDDLVDKVVHRRRGGISFELNILLADALRDIGFKVELMSAKHPKYGHEFDHAFLMVGIPEEEGEWLVDVGYTESYRMPLLFDCRIWQSDGRDAYTFERDANDAEVWRLLRRRGERVELVYSFKLEQHTPDDYRDQCTWFCTDKRSRFTQGPFVFIERPEGRICLSMDTVENTFTGEAIRPVIQSKEEGRAVLREIFGIEVDGGASSTAIADGKFGYTRVFAAIGDDDLQDAVVEKAAQIALEKKAHLRFGHIVAESTWNREGDGGFPTYVQSVRARLRDSVSSKLNEMGVSDEILGGEVVVMGSNSRIGATIDAPADYAPDQLVESLIKPFNPDIVVCGGSNKSKLRSFIQGSAEGYLTRKLDCQVIGVK